MMEHLETCQLCGLRAEALRERHGVNTCRACMTLFWFAEVLFEADVTEKEIVPTLAFAQYAETLWGIRDPERRTTAARQLVSQYPAFDLVEVVGGVPLVRIKEAFAEAARYPGSVLVRGVRVRVLSRFARPGAVARLYAEVCESEGLPFDMASAGSISWDCSMHLKVRVGPREEIHATRLDQFREYPRVRRFAFPLPSVVEAVVGGLLGAGQNKNLMFGAFLSDLGRSEPRMYPETAITACVLWYLRGKWIEGKPTVSRSSEAAGLVYQLLLKPLDKARFDITRNDAVWGNAKKVANCFDRCRLLLQGTRDNSFKKRLSTAP